MPAVFWHSLAWPLPTRNKQGLLCTCQSNIKQAKVFLVSDFFIGLFHLLNHIKRHRLSGRPVQSCWRLNQTARRMCWPQHIRQIHNRGLKTFCTMDAHHPDLATMFGIHIPFDLTSALSKKIQKMCKASLTLLTMFAGLKQEGIQTVINSRTQSAMKCLSASFCQHQTEKLKYRKLISKAQPPQELLGSFGKRSSSLSCHHQSVKQAGLTPTSCQLKQFIFS